MDQASAATRPAKASSPRSERREIEYAQSVEFGLGCVEKDLPRVSRQGSSWQRRRSADRRIRSRNRNRARAGWEDAAHAAASIFRRPTRPSRRARSTRKQFDFRHVRKNSRSMIVATCSGFSEWRPMLVPSMTCAAARLAPVLAHCRARRIKRSLDFLNLCVHNCSS